MQIPFVAGEVHDVRLKRPPTSQESPYQQQYVIATSGVEDGRGRINDETRRKSEDVLVGESVKWVDGDRPGSVRIDLDEAHRLIVCEVPRPSPFVRPDLVDQAIDSLPVSVKERDDELAELHVGFVELKTGGDVQIAELEAKIAQMTLDAAAPRPAVDPPKPTLASPGDRAELARLSKVLLDKTAAIRELKAENFQLEKAASGNFKDTMEH